MLRIALEGPDENFDNIIIEEKLSTSSYMLTLHFICPMQVTLLVQKLQLCFPILRMSISLKVA